MLIVLAKLIAVFLLAYGGFGFAKPEVLLKTIDWWEQGKRLYLASLLRLFFAVVLLGAASAARTPMILTVLGILCLIGGLTILVLGLERTKKFMNRYRGLSPSVMRYLSLISVALGALLLYAI